MRKIVYLHIPKCAGTSVENWILRHINRDEAFVHNKFWKLKNESIFRLSKKKVISGHIRAYHPKIMLLEFALGKRNLVYCSVVRCPIDQVASHINYIKARPEHPYYFADSIERAIARKADFFSWQTNMQCKFFSQKGTFDAAIKWMSKRNVIIDPMDRLDHHIERLAAEMNVPSDKIGSANKAISPYEDLKKNAALISYVEENCAEDTMLYEHLSNDRAAELSQWQAKRGDQ